MALHSLQMQHPPPLSIHLSESAEGLKPKCDKQQRSLPSDRPSLSDMHTGDGGEGSEVPALPVGGTPMRPRALY